MSCKTRCCSFAEHFFHKGRILFALIEGVGGEGDKTIRVLKNRSFPLDASLMYYIRKMMISPAERIFFSPAPLYLCLATSFVHSGR